MRLTAVTAPAEELLTLEEVKDQLRIVGDYDDAILQRLMRSARQGLDGRDGILGRALITQTWGLSLERFPAEIIVPLPPLISVGSITYLDPSGNEQNLDPSAYRVEGIGDADAGRIVPVTAWPATQANRVAVAVTFTAGYGDRADVPEPIRHAALMHVAFLYEQREAASELRNRAVPFGYYDAIAPYREIPV